MPAFSTPLKLGAVFVKASTISSLDNRPAIALSFLILVRIRRFQRRRGRPRLRHDETTGVHGNAPRPDASPDAQGHASRRRLRFQHKGRTTVIDVAKRAGSFATLLTAVDKAGLTALLEGDGPFTLFAPNEAAFADLPDGALQELLADKAKLTALLKYHLVADRVSAADVLTKRTLETASGQELPTSDLSVIRADIRAGNGIIHVVDKVLLPSG